MITIYCHIHRASGRRYVGQTRYSMEKRWRQHIYNAIRGDCRVFAAAILEYGPDAFDHAVLEVCETSASANDAERRWIEHFDSCAPNGFNLKLGASGGKGAVHPETCAMISASKTGWWAQQSPAQRAAIARTARDTREGRMTLADKEARSERGRAAARHFDRTPEGQARAAWASRASLMAQSPEKQAEISQKHRALWTPERRAAASALAKAQRAAETPEVKAKRYARVAASVKAAWDARTPEERARVTAAVSAGLLSATPEQRSDRTARGHATRKRRESLALGRRAASAIASKLATLTPEQRVVLLSTVPDVERIAS